MQKSLPIFLMFSPVFYTCLIPQQFDLDFGVEQLCLSWALTAFTLVFVKTAPSALKIL